MKLFRKIAILVVGTLSLIVGIIIFPLPIPLGLIIIVFSLFLLAREFAWARRIVDTVMRKLNVNEQTLQQARHLASKLYFWKRSPKPPMQSD